MKKNKATIIAIGVIVLILAGSLIFSIVKLNNMDTVINRLENEVSNLKKDKEKLEKKVAESNYNLDLYRELYGMLNSSNKEENFGNEEDNNKDENAQVPEEKPNDSKNDFSNIKVITYKQFKTMLSNEEDFILLLSQQGCSHCIQYKPIYNETLRENNLIGYEIDIMKISEKDYKDLMNDIKNITGTPTTLFYKKGVELDESTRIVGGNSKEFLIKHLKDNGYIK